MFFVNNLTNYAFKNTQSVLPLCFLRIVYYSTEHWTHQLAKKRFYEPTNSTHERYLYFFVKIYRTYEEYIFMFMLMFSTWQRINILQNLYWAW